MEPAHRSREQPPGLSLGALPGLTFLTKTTASPHATSDRRDTKLAPARCHSDPRGRPSLLSGDARLRLGGQTGDAAAQDPPPGAGFGVYGPRYGRTHP